MLRWLTSLLVGSDPHGFDRLGNQRSSKWPRVRDRHLAAFPRCSVCGKKENLRAHHIKPYHLFPELELDPENLLTTCEGEVVNCHLLFGHLMDWRAWNPKVIEHAAMIRAAIMLRAR